VVQTSFASASVFERSWKRVESFFDKVAPGCPIISCSELEFRSRSCVGDQQGIRPPREIVWLNGAPGSGKGANTDFILEIRGLKRAVTVSQLLDDHPESKWLKEEGKLVPDEVVVEALLKAVLNPDSNDGVGILVDGFPRTALQVDAVQELYKKLLCLHDEHRGTPSEDMFPRPSFKRTVFPAGEGGEEGTRHAARPPTTSRVPSRWSRCMWTSRRVSSGRCSGQRRPSLRSGA